MIHRQPVGLQGQRRGLPRRKQGKFPSPLSSGLSGGQLHDHQALSRTNLSSKPEFRRPTPAAYVHGQTILVSAALCRSFSCKALPPPIPSFIQQTCVECQARARPCTEVRAVYTDISCHWETASLPPKHYATHVSHNGS